MRKALFITAAVVVVLLVALDRIGLAIADSQIANRVQKSQGLASRPNVSIKGFPFLTQVISGHYGEVDVAVRDFTRSGLTVDRVSVHAHGVSVPLGRVLSGGVREVPVQRADAQVILGFGNLNNYISSQLGQVLTVSSDGKSLRLSGTLPFPPRVSLTAEARVDVSGNSITLRPAALDTVLAKIPGAQASRSLIARFFTVKLPISQLPFGIRLQQATITRTGILIAASATGLTLRAPSG